jgi:ATP-dependent RNA helicase DDX41
VVVHEYSSDNDEQIQEVDEIEEIDKALEELKKKVREAEAVASKKAMKSLEALQAEHRHMVNKRRECVIGLRKKYKIKVEGAANENEIPEPVETFEKMQKLYSWSQGFMKRLKENECIKPTPVQIQTIPAMVARKSAVVLAETGSGKSLAFIAPLLH